MYRPLAIVLLTATPVLADFEWTGDASANWFDAGNWLKDGARASEAPGCGSETGATACIPIGVETILTKCQSGSLLDLNSIESVARLDFAGAIRLLAGGEIEDFETSPGFNLDLQSSLTVRGTDCVWAHGHIHGGGSIFLQGTLEITGTSAPTLGVSLTNNGTVSTIEGVTVSNDETIINWGTWEGPGTVSRTGSPTSEFFNAGGTVVNNLPATELRFSLPVNDTSGTVTADGADVRYSYGGKFEDTQFTVASGGEVRIDEQPGASLHTIEGACQVSGTGQFTIARDVSTQPEATLTVNLSPGGTQGFLLENSAFLYGNGTLTNAGTMTWKAGLLSIPMTNTATGTVTIAAGGNDIQSTQIMLEYTNLGTWRVEDEFRNKGTIVTKDGGVFELRSNRIIDTGSIDIEQNGLFLHPIDSPPGWVEVGCFLVLDQGQLINETGELRLTGAGHLSGATIRGEARTATRIRASNYSATGSTFDGDGDLIVESNAALDVGLIDVTNRIGDGGAGAFRLGSTSGGTIKANYTGQFHNRGDFRWVSGNLETPAGFLNFDRVTTENPNHDVKGKYENKAGTTFVNHAVQVEGAGNSMACFGGRIKQTNATVSINHADAFIGAVSPGVWELNGTSGINGIGTIDFDLGGTLEKTGSGTATVSADMSVGDANIEVWGGILAFTNQPNGPPPILRLWNVKMHSGTILRLNGTDYAVGPANESVIGQIQGVVNLAAGPVEPPRFECDTFVNEGRLRPGGADGAGEFVIAADYAMSDTGILSVNIGADAQDLLTIEGTAQLAGTLRVNLLDDYVPTTNASFTVAGSTGAMTGAFDTITGDGSWSAEIDGADLIITMTAPPTCPADFLGGDGDAGLDELLSLLANWGFAPSHPADLNGDDEVGFSDLVLLLAAWGPCGS